MHRIQPVERRIMEKEEEITYLMDNISHWTIIESAQNLFITCDTHLNVEIISIHVHYSDTIVGISPMYIIEKK